MWLLNTSSYKLEDASDPGERGEYAILSHRWVGEEIRFQTLIAANLKAAEAKAADLPDSSERHKYYDRMLSEGQKEAASLYKIAEACALARRQGLEYVWIDTCCIDKTNNTELAEALNSMFKWYREAAVCYTYLYDVDSAAKLRQFESVMRKGESSEWFERGWTLQELLAPRKLEFYDRAWQFLGTRGQLAAKIQNITTIDQTYLADGGTDRFRKASAATKMSWMAGRTTRNHEDIAYSLLGIFNVYMNPIPGEGSQAFIRLQEQLLQGNAFDESLFGWTIPKGRKLNCYRTYRKREGNLKAFVPVWNIDQAQVGLLAPSPDCFAGNSHLSIVSARDVGRLGGGFQRTHQGITCSLPIRAVRNDLGFSKKEMEFALNCWQHDGSGRPSAVVLRLRRARGDQWVREQADILESKQRAKVDSLRYLNGRYLAYGKPLTVTITIAQPQSELDYPGL